MSIEEAQIIIEKEYEEKINYNKNILKKKEKMKKRYFDTLSEVVQWQPPSKDHIHLKEFAIEQLKESIKHDCEGYEKYYPLEIEKEVPKEYIQKNIERCLHDIERYKKEYQDEVDRINDRNKWIKDLRESL